MKRLAREALAGDLAEDLGALDDAHLDDAYLDDAYLDDAYLDDASGADDDAGREALLAALGEGLAQSRWSDAERARLPALRAHAASKRFSTLLDTALVPESALELSRRLSRHAPSGRALLHGGFTGLSPALSLDVTELHDEGAALVAPLARGFDLVAIDTLAYEGLQAGALSRGVAALVEGGRLVAFGHAMQRPFLRELFEAARLEVIEPLFEIAARLHPGYALDPFLWDVWVLAPAGEPLLDDDAPLEAARGFDPTERAPGCLDVKGFAPGALSAAGMDASVRLFEAAGVATVQKCFVADDEGCLRRHLALGSGAMLTLSASPAQGELHIDLMPWSPAPLYAAVTAVRLGNRALSTTRGPE